MVEHRPPAAPTDLPWAFLGRRVKPLALAASVADFGIGLGFFDPDSYFSQVPHALVILTALLAVLAFWVGWWLNMVRLVQVGLLLTVGVFSAHAALSVFIDHGLFEPLFWLSVSWAAAGAFLLEKRAPRGWEPEVYGGQKR